MALLNKGQIRTAVQQAIDDAGAKRWSAANLDVLITMVADMMWSAILDTFDDATSQSDTVTPSSGAVDITTLTKRFYRTQKVTKVSDSSDLQARRYRESVPQASYYMLGNNIVTDPAVSGASSLTVTYSYLPPSFTGLANDGTSLPTEYPEGHEMALVYLAASAALIKGDAENMTQVGRMADVAVEALLTHIARRVPVSTSLRIAQVKASIMRNPLVSGGSGG
jgi:hypothetical protein